MSRHADPYPLLRGIAQSHLRLRLNISSTSGMPKKGKFIGKTKHSNVNTHTNSNYRLVGVHTLTQTMTPEAMRSPGLQGDDMAGVILHLQDTPPRPEPRWPLPNPVCRSPSVRESHHAALRRTWPSRRGTAPTWTACFEMETSSFINQVLWIDRIIHRHDTMSAR